jgi:hypothetical protein
MWKMATLWYSENDFHLCYFDVAYVTLWQVFNHMVSENVDSFDKNITYEMWISNFKTRRNVADKCAEHGLFSLAADFYGQGLVRDRNAYVKSSLWIRFAKSCFRCGRPMPNWP